MIQRAGVLSAVVAPVGAFSGAAAQEPQDKAFAEALFQEAQSLMRKGQTPDASKPAVESSLPIEAHRQPGKAPERRPYPSGHDSLSLSLGPLSGAAAITMQGGFKQCDVD